MKKLVIISLSILIATFVIISAITAQDLRKQFERATYYAKEFESGNMNYAQFSVYLNSLESDMDALLKSSSIDNKEITAILGEPKMTVWVLSNDLTTEIQNSNEVPVWSEKIIYDGDKIQLRVTLYPVLYQNNLVYTSQISAVFKDINPDFNLKDGIEESRKLANVFYLDQNVQTANDLAESSVNLEKLSESYFKQTSRSCDDIMSEAFGSQSFKSKEGVISKVYEIHNKAPYYVKADLMLCDDCGEDNWIRLDFSVENTGRKIGFDTPEISASDYQDVGVNGIKSSLINENRIISQSLDAGDYKTAYASMKRMELLYDIWDDLIKKEDTQTNKVIAYSDKVKFTSGLFEGYPLIATTFNEQTVYENVLFREVDSNATESCTNKVDDNSDQKIDCEDSLCSGQFCGSKTVNVTEENQTLEKVIDMYCVFGTCQEKKEEPKNLCGDGICQSNESCSQDCASAPIACPTYSPVSCDGDLISKGQDANGCALEPVCIKKISSCSSNADCDQPLCGTSECLSGQCQVTKIDQCNQKQCIDGEKKTLQCTTGEKITSESCNNGVWKGTGQSCPTAPITDVPIVQDSVLNVKKCAVKEDCGEGYVCDLNVCKYLVANSKETSVVKSADAPSGITFTGKVVVINGGLTNNAQIITGIVGPESDSTQVNPTTVPKRTYNENPQGNTVSKFTSVVGIQGPAEVIEPKSPRELTTQELFSSKGETLSTGIKEEFTVTGVCKENRESTEAEIYFSGGGEKFGGISYLMDQYREKGIEWCDRELKILLDQRAQLEESFNDDFAKWFFESYLTNNANDWGSKRDAINSLYFDIANNQIQIARMMNCLSLKELSKYNPITIDYATSFGELKYNEVVEPTLIPGLSKTVYLTSPSMQASIFLDKDFVKKSLIVSMNAGNFPGSSSTNYERKLNKGLTASELIKFNEDEQLKSKIKELASNYKDGYIDAQVLFVENNNGVETNVYNLYVRLNENNIQIQPMTPENIPPVDVKITVDYSALYSLMAASEENLKETETFNPPWKAGEYSVSQIVNLFGNWIKTQLKTSEYTNSLQVQPDNSQMKSIFEDISFMIAEN